MPDTNFLGLPDDVRRLLHERLDSIAQIDLLLLLQSVAPDEWTASQVSEELRTDRAWVAEQFLLLRDRGLLCASSGAPDVYRFQPATPELAKAVEGLASCYADQRVTVVRFLYSKPADGIRVFADAFRVRREDDHG